MHKISKKQLQQQNIHISLLSSFLHEKKTEGFLNFEQTIIF